MPSPIRLYLDTSDYAAMYDAPSEKIAGVRDYLFQMKDTGRIEIGLSYHIAFELLQEAEPKYREDRLSRAKLLTRLCDKNAFPYPTDVPQGHRFSRDGCWVPRIWLEEIEIERILQLIMRQIERHPSLNRHQRKSFRKREYFISWSHQNPFAFQKIVKEVWPLRFGREFYQNGDLSRYLSSHISRNEANEKLRFFITDPVTLYEIWFESYGRENPLPGVRDPVANLIARMIGELKQMLDEHESLRDKISEVLGPDGCQLSTENRQKIIGIRKELKIFRSEITSPEDMAKAPAWKEAVGDVGALLAAQVFHAFHREKRTIKPSDAIDLIHNMYLPHADLWRGDRAFGTMLVNNRVNFHERIVTSLLDLPTRIEREITNRAV